MHAQATEKKEFAQSVTDNWSKFVNRCTVCIRSPDR